MSKIDALKTLQIGDLQRQSPKNQKAGQEDDLKVRDFGQTISDFVRAVNDKQVASAEQVADVIQGRSQNLHQAMASMEEARLSFQLMIEVRNKLLESYKELERMPV